MLGTHEKMGKKMIEVITSFNQIYYDLIGRDSVNSFLQHWPEDFSITCYVEGFSLPEHKRIKQIDFDQLDPDYEKFQLDTMFSQSDKKFSKKAYSVMHSLMHSQADWIVWQDADVLTLKTIPQSLIDSLLRPECLSMYMGVTYYESKSRQPGEWLCPETGIFAVNTRHREFHAFRTEYIRRYHERDYKDLRRFYDNDVFGAALNSVNAQNNDLCYGFEKKYKTPMPHTVLGPYLMHYKAKHSKAEYSKADVSEICFDPDLSQYPEDQ